MAHLKDLLVAGPSRFIGEVAFNDNVTFNDSVTLNETLILAKNPQDAEGTSEAYPALIIGDNGSAGIHLAIDGNEIIAKSDIDSPGVLYINNNGGDTSFGGNVVPKATGTLDLGTSSIRWKTLYVGNGTGSTSSSTGGIQVNGGIGTSGASYIGGALVVNGAITGNSTLTVSGVAQTGNTLTIYNSSGGDTVLYFNRSTSAGWKIRDSSAVLYFSTDWDPATNKKNENGVFIDKVNFDISGNITAVGRVSSKGVTSSADISPSSNAGSGMTLGTSSKKWKTLYVGDGADATSTSTGVIQATGGIAATKAGYFGGGLTAKTLTITDTNAVEHIKFTRANVNYITTPSSGKFAFVVNGKGAGASAEADLVIMDGAVYPGTTEVTSLGQSDSRWTTVYSKDINATGNLTVSGTAAIAKDTTIGNGTASTSMTTGALKVTGGVGVSGQLNAKTVRIDNAAYFQYNSTDKCIDVIFG